MTTRKTSRAFRGWYHRRYRAAEVFTVLLNRPTLLTSLSMHLSSLLSFSPSVALRRVVVQRRPYWRSDLEGIKNLPRDASRLEALFPLLVSTGCSVPLARTRLSSTPSISHFLLSPSYRLSSLSLLLSLPLFLFFVTGALSSFCLVFSVSLQDPQPSFECAFPLLSLVVSILPTVHLPRSYGSFVSLVISSCGHRRVSLRLASFSLTGLSLQLESCGRFPSCSFWHYGQLVSVSLLASLEQPLSSSHARDIGPDTGGYMYAKGPVWVGLYQFLRNNRTIE